MKYLKRSFCIVLLVTMLGGNVYTAYASGLEAIVAGLSLSAPQVAIAMMALGGIYVAYEHREEIGDAISGWVKDTANTIGVGKKVVENFFRKADGGFIDMESPVAELYTTKIQDTVSEKLSTVGTSLDFVSHDLASDYPSGFDIIPNLKINSSYFEDFGEPIGFFLYENTSNETYINACFYALKNHSFWYYDSYDIGHNVWIGDANKRDFTYLTVPLEKTRNPSLATDLYFPSVQNLFDYIDTLVPLLGTGSSAPELPWEVDTTGANTDDNVVDIRQYLNPKNDNDDDNNKPKYPNGIPFGFDINKMLKPYIGDNVGEQPEQPEQPYSPRSPFDNALDRIIDTAKNNETNGDPDANKELQKELVTGAMPDGAPEPNFNPDAPPTIDPSTTPAPEDNPALKPDPEEQPVKKPDSDSGAEDYALDLTQIFPFCIPFDLYYLIKAFDASPVAPSVKLHTSIPVVDVNFDYEIDMSVADKLASLVRGLELVLFIIGLMLVTKKLIKW